jgi:hypothetical protein
LKIIRCEAPRDFILYDSGDLHLGTTNTHKEGILEMLERVKENQVARLILKGDNVDAMPTDDPRYDPYGIDHSQGTQPLDQLKGLEGLIQQYGIEGKIVAIGQGNHEARLDKFGLPVRDMCERLGVPYMGWVAVIHYVDESGKLMFKHFAHHGRNIARSNAKDAIQRKANRSASLKRLMDATGFTDVLYFSMGHTHDPLVVKPTIDDEVMLRTTFKRYDGDKVVEAVTEFSINESDRKAAEKAALENDYMELLEKPSIQQEYRSHTDPAADFIPPAARWYSITPSFLRLYSDPSDDANAYGEKAMYAPVKLGWNQVTVEDGNIVDIQTVEV